MKKKLLCALLALMLMLLPLSGCTLFQNEVEEIGDEEAAPYYALAENGRLIFLNRDLAMIPTDGRPISQAVPLARLYRMRLPLYRSWCDAELTITGMQPDEAARHIIDML